VITGALLFVLFAAAILSGGHGPFGPSLRDAISAPGAKAMGNVLYTMQAESCPLTLVKSAADGCSKPRR
jgi:hypothetical protein